MMVMITPNFNFNGKCNKAIDLYQKAFGEGSMPGWTEFYSEFFILGRNDVEKIELSDKSPSISGIFAGISKGEVWYDDDFNPSIGVAYSYPVGGYGIIGKLSEDRKRNRDFFERVFNDLRRTNRCQFEFSTEEKQLSEELLKLFKDKKIWSEMEFSYRIGHKIESLSARQSSTVSYHIVDRSFLEKIYSGEILNSDILTDRLENSWASIEDFIKYSKAIVAMKENRIVGVIFGSSRYKQFIAVDIEVSEEDRRQGIGAGMVKEFVNLCIDDDLVVQWDHVESNQASRYLALKSGFVLFKSRPYYWFNI